MTRNLATLADHEFLGYVEYLGCDSEMHAGLELS